MGTLAGSNHLEISTKRTLFVAKENIRLEPNLVEFFVENPRREEKTDGFYILDMERTIILYNKWRANLPRVRPFYAIKCNPDPVFIRQLYMLGSGFDCASQGEIELALELGILPKDIIYANPCKKPSHLSFAVQRGISRMTFDSKEELEKIAEICPRVEILLRLAPRIVGALYDVNNCKYGAPFEECANILAKAKELGLNVVGVCFHVGTYCFNELCFEDCIHIARQIFDEGEKLGFSFSILDIGGGFPGSEVEDDLFFKMCNVINRSLDEHFPVSSGITIIAEPGTYFACSPFTLATNIIAVKEVERRIFKNVSDPPVKFTDDGPQNGFMYLVDDGIFGSFSVLFFKPELELEPFPLLKSPSDKLYPSCVWGQSLSGADFVNKKGCQLPKMLVGDWLYFTEFGAYSSSLASNFNGFSVSKHTYYYITMETWEKMNWKCEDFRANISFIDKEKKEIYHF